MGLQKSGILTHGMSLGAERGLGGMEWGGLRSKVLSSREAETHVAWG